MQALTRSSAWGPVMGPVLRGFRGPSEYELNSVAVVNVKAERAAGTVPLSLIYYETYAAVR